MEETNKPKKTYLLTSFARTEGVDQGKTLFREFEYTPENKELEYTFLEYDKEEKTPLPVLGPLSQINVFIGQNNSRKSRLLRQIAAAKEDSLVFFDWHRNPMEEIREFLEFARDLMAKEILPKNEYLKYDHIDIKFGEPSLYNFSSKTKFEERGYRQTKFTRSNWPNIAYQHILKPSNSSREYAELEKFIKHLYFIALSIDCIYTIISLIGDESYFNDPQFQNIPFLRRSQRMYMNQKRDNNKKYEISPVLKTVKHFLDFLDVFDAFLKEKKQFGRRLAEKGQDSSIIYIPTLRGAGTLYQKQKDELTSISQDIYQESVYKYYYGLDKDSIYTGQSLYKDIRKSRNGRKKQRDAFSEFEKFIREQFFPNHDEVDIVALEEEEGGNINIYLEKDSDEGRELHHLGDGLQALILMLYPIFMAEKGSIFLIEEPEMHLHPGLLSTFIRTLLREEKIKKKELRFFFSTHSTHLLDFVYEAPEDFSLFALEQNHKSKGSSYIRQIKEKDIALLNLMGVNNSSLFIANSSIWVEGHTDRKYIQGLLYAFEQELKRLKKDSKLEQILSVPLLQEDLHYCFFEFAGSNLAHYIFFDEEENATEDQKRQREEELDSLISAGFLHNRICLIHDKDKTLTKDRRHVKNKENESDSFKYVVTAGREIENILSQKTWEYLINKVLLNKRAGKCQFDVNESEYDETNTDWPQMGKILSDFFEKKGIDKVFKFTSGSSSYTINPRYKKQLADAFLKAVLNGDLKWAEIESPGTKAMLKEVYLFIAEHNPNLFSAETIDGIKELLA